MPNQTKEELSLKNQKNMNLKNMSPLKKNTKKKQMIPIKEIPKAKINQKLSLNLLKIKESLILINIMQIEIMQEIIEVVI